MINAAATAPSAALVGLRQDRRAGLLQDLGLGHVRHFGGVIGVLDARTGVGQVVDHVVQVVDGRLQAVLHGAQFAGELVQYGEGGIQRRERITGLVSLALRFRRELAISADVDRGTDLGRIDAGAIASP